MTHSDTLAAGLFRDILLSHNVRGGTASADALREEGKLFAPLIGGTVFPPPVETAHSLPLATVPIAKERAVRLLSINQSYPIQMNQSITETKITASKAG